MLHLQYARRRPLALAVLAVASGLLGWFAYSQGTAAPREQASRTETVRIALANLPTVNPADLLDPNQGYTFQDGTILDGSDGTRFLDSAPDGSTPGNLDVLDIAKANALAEQQKKGQKKDQKKDFKGGKGKGGAGGGVVKTSITANWFANNTRFWYRNDLKGGAKEFILVDAEKGTRAPAFDHQKLAEGLSKVSNSQYQGNKLPFDSITLTDDLKTVQFKVGDASWQCDLASYQCTSAKGKEPELIPAPLPEPPDPNEENISRGEYGMGDEPFDAEELAQLEMQQKKKGGGQKKGEAPGAREAKSPDGNWTAVVKDFNVYLRDKNGAETKLTQNGVAGNAYGSLVWSPDSNTLVFYRTEPGDGKEVYMIESSPKDQLPAKLHVRPYPRPGDKFPLHEMWLCPVATLQAARADVERIDFKGIPRLRWSKDGKHFTFEKSDRGHQRFRIVEVEARTGRTRNIYDEKTDTFIDKYSKNYLQYLDDTNEILLTAELDGWKHLYLIDAKTGKLQQITRGEYVVRNVDSVDLKNRQIWFQASGKNADQDPYLIHFYRVNFDGTGLVALTAGNGNHGVKYSPDKKYIIDTYSRVDLPPVHELRRVSDGVLVCELEKADVSALEGTGWRMPEVFVNKARDGKTDIWGIVVRPKNYDKSKKYPIIEYIYAGPQGSFTPKTFAASRGQMQTLADLGFIVVQCDGLGTANRSRAFHDVCWKNLADAGFPDRILWIKALAKQYPYMDTSRVGIYGTSAGGQNSTGAVLFHPEFYKVAVSACGCHDNRLDKASWNEQWMGVMGPHYAEQSNVTNAHKLQGKLLLIVGELDTNVPFESTMRVVDALIKAQKDFDLLFVPGMGHSNGGAYGSRRQSDFFVRHLQGAETPDRNAVRPGGKKGDE